MCLFGYLYLIELGPYTDCSRSLVHFKPPNINLHNIIHSLISQNHRERMFIVQISLLVVTFLSLIHRESCN